jgi:hypothetical protein
VHSELFNEIGAEIKEINREYDIFVAGYAFFLLLYSYQHHISVLVYVSNMVLKFSLPNINLVRYYNLNMTSLGGDMLGLLIDGYS